MVSLIDVNTFVVDFTEPDVLTQLEATPGLAQPAQTPGRSFPSGRKDVLGPGLQLFRPGNGCRVAAPSAESASRCRLDADYCEFSLFLSDCGLLSSERRGW